jgi:hypothetical protein
MRLAFTAVMLAAMLACSAGQDTLAGGSEEGLMVPTVTGLSPESGPVGTEVVLHGSGFRATGNAVRFGDGYVRDLESSDGTTLAFEVPEGLDRCAPGASGPCPGGFARVKPGPYDVVAWTPDGTSEPLTFTVTDGP